MAKNKYIKCTWFLSKKENMKKKDLCISDLYRKDGCTVECSSVKNCKFKQKVLILPLL